jgi:hypothetical protein
VKVRLDKLTCEVVEREIPATCPGCDEPIAGSEVKVDTWDAATYFAEMDLEPDERGQIRWEWGDDDSGEGEYITGIRHHCGTVLASTDL